METLAVVAYRQPVLRAEIEAIRGVQSGEVLRQLIERDLVRIVGRSDELGRPFLYGTTKQFLRVFGLRHLDELPRADVLRNCPSSVTPPINTDHIGPDADSPNPSHQSPVAEEETNVSTLITTEPWQNSLAEEACATATRPHNDLPGKLAIVDTKDEETEYADELDEEQDFEEEDDEEKEDEEEEDDEDLDDEPWEEVDDDDEDEEDLDEDEDEDKDWDEDEDWEDEDEDWEDEDEDDDWDDEEDEEEEPED